MLSAKDAAAAVGLSKAGIIKAIRSGKISGQKNVHGNWEVDAAELYRVYTPVATNSPPTSVDQLTVVHTSVDPSLTTELAVLRAQLAGKDDLLAAKDEIIDELRHRVNLLTTTQPPAPPTPRPSWWRRLWGK